VPQLGYQTQLAATPTYKNMVTAVDLGPRNSTVSPYFHMGTTRNGCAPSSTTQCCIYADAGYRYDYWWALGSGRVIFHIASGRPAILAATRALTPPAFTPSRAQDRQLHHVRCYLRHLQQLQQLRLHHSERLRVRLDRGDLHAGLLLHLRAPLLLDALLPATLAAAAAALPALAALAAQAPVL
jgi:hypothetical protein